MNTLPKRTCKGTGRISRRTVGRVDGRWLEQVPDEEEEDEEEEEAAEEAAAAAAAIKKVDQ